MLFSARVPEADNGPQRARKPIEMPYTGGFRRRLQYSKARSINRLCGPAEGSQSFTDEATAMKVKTAKAAILVQSRQPLVVDQITFPDALGVGQVLAKLLYT